MTWTEGKPILGQLFSERFENEFGSRRCRENQVERRHENLAASLQTHLEEIVVHQWTRLHGLTRSRNLAYAGGVAFNCVANGLVFGKTPFEDLYIQPAAGDAGLAIGAAYHVWHQVLGRPRSFVMDHAFWCPEFSDAHIRQVLERSELNSCFLPDDRLFPETARHIADGKLVGWFQGRLEWGPRALGNRSIVVDPRRDEMRDILNTRIKHREPFRPFAPSILAEYAGQYFEDGSSSPFMLRACRVRREKLTEIPAPTHVDGTGRVQTVSRDVHPRYWKLIEAFRRLTGVPVVLNTSFNENEPIVCTPDEAVDCFLRTKMDVLAIGNHLVKRDA